VRLQDSVLHLTIYHSQYFVTILGTETTREIYAENKVSNGLPVTGTDLRNGIDHLLGANMNLSVILSLFLLRIDHHYGLAAVSRSRRRRRRETEVRQQWGVRGFQHKSDKPIPRRGYGADNASQDKGKSASGQTVALVRDSTRCIRRFRIGPVATQDSNNQRSFAFSLREQLVRSIRARKTLAVDAKINN
jgi:hypothetical protein